MSTRSKSKAAATLKQRRGKPKVVEEKENEPKPEEAFCSCRKGDDGSPMILCSQCTEWYHFTCVNLTEPDAENIYMYVCPTCTEKTGLRSVMTWEGVDGLEPIAPKKTKPARKTERVLEELPPSDSDNEPSSQDEYVAESEKAKVKGTKRRTRRLAYSDSESESSSASERPKRRGKASSPSLKRKTTPSSNQPASKRKKTNFDDPTRKYCLGKLDDVFRDIFLRYPHLKEGDERVEKKPDELSEEDKSKLLDEAKQFAIDLEHCVYETYSEPDKQGKTSAGGKYKDRFRMLQFNLSKVDRVVLHKRIASRHISAEEISVMSSTDLANEETKQSIKIAEKEALEHSILQKTSAPRAKITHKGLQDIEIEDIDGTETAMRERERQRELEQEERMERERLARIKATRQRTASVSVPPESPVTPQSAAPWGGPPALPVHALSDTFVPQDIPMGSPEMDLGDLINIDDEPPTSAQEEVPASPVEPSPSEPPSPPPPPTVGISPFASNVVRPEVPRTTFDLNSLWSAPADKVTESEPPPSEETPKETVPEPPAAAVDEQDFDMFLEENDQSSPEALQAAFDAKETVWTGKINMPLDSTIPQETPVIARQVAGRPLAGNSPLWNSLFPSDLLRIDGRVPVDKSAQFLLQIRMNPSKELMAVAFSPTSPNNDIPFKILMDFLIAKGRHGLVFPWGNRPKDTHPGRELYIIPLLSSDPLPDYMQLLDNLQLPKIRQVNYLIGIWILGKGKLKAPSPPPAPVPAPQPSISPAVPDLSQLLPQLSSTIAKLPASFDQKALAAEVAQLTPIQVQEMLRTLSAVTNPPPAVPAPAPVVQPQVPPPNIGMPPGYPGFPGYYQQPPPFPPQVPGGPPPPAQFGRPPYDRTPGGHRGQDNRGRRGRGGRNNNNRHDDGSQRSQDSGWPRRGGPPSSGNPAYVAARRW